MKDFTRDEAYSRTNKAKEVIHRKNSRIAHLWWKYIALRKINKATKKGKNHVRILAPIKCSAEIGDLLTARKFYYNTYQRNIFLTDVWIEWY